MADYDWGPECGCGFVQEHRRLCKDNPNYALNVAIDKAIAEAKEEGFIYIGTANDEGLTRIQMLWGCKRGCGSVVWNMDDHRKNVCPDYA